MSKKEVSLEETFAQIESIIDEMEQPNVTLEDSFQLFKSGMEKIQQCHILLDRVEKKMQMIEDDKLVDFNRNGV